MMSSAATGWIGCGWLPMSTGRPPRMNFASVSLMNPTRNTVDATGLAIKSCSPRALECSQG